MPLDTIFSFLTYPHRNRPDEPLALGAHIRLGDDKLSGMLRGVFDNTGRDCVVPVIFPLTTRNTILCETNSWRL